MRREGWVWEYIFFLPYGNKLYFFFFAFDFVFFFLLFFIFFIFFIFFVSLINIIYSIRERDIEREKERFFIFKKVQSI